MKTIPTITKDTAGEWFTKLLSLYCGHPVTVTTTILAANGRVEVAPAPEDMRSLIGKGGENIRALKEITRRVGAAINRNLDLSVIEPGRRDVSVMPFEKRASYPRAAVIEVLTEMVNTLSGGVCEATLSDFQDGVTIIEITGARLDDEAKAAVRVVFRAVGRTQGRYFQIDFPTLT